MRVKWVIPLALLCVVPTAVVFTGCGRSGTEQGGNGPGQAPLQAEEQRPVERVEPAPEVNTEAVVWRTPEPPANPQPGDVWVNPKDGMEMVYVPAGEFTLGMSDADIEAWLRSHRNDFHEWFADEQPQCQVRLDSYWIGRTEVTNMQYRRFVEATGHRPPDYWERPQYEAGLGNLPVVFVDWSEANAYCEWAGGHLPTELEWEKAARGSDGRVLPWGNQWDENRCRSLSLITGETYANVEQVQAALHTWSSSHDPALEGPAAVGSYPAGASPYGCMDMAGNAWEWCADWYEENAYQVYAGGDLKPPAAGRFRVCRGGSWHQGQPFAFRCTGRGVTAFEERYEFLGFRCARAAGP